MSAPAPLPDALQTLREFAIWHRGFREPKPPTAAVVEAIDVVIGWLVSLEYTDIGALAADDRAAAALEELSQ